MKSGGVFFVATTPPPPKKDIMVVNLPFPRGFVWDIMGYPGDFRPRLSLNSQRDFCPRGNFAVLVVLADLPKMDLSHMMTARLVEGKFHDGGLGSRFFHPEINYRVFFKAPNGRVEILT